MLIKAPARVGDNVIEKCYQSIDSPMKRYIRKILISYIKKRKSLTDLGDGFQWGHPLGIAKGSKIGRYVYIGAGFESHGVVVIGDLTMISSDCQIVGADHLYDVIDKPMRLAFGERISKNRPITNLGVDVWIGKRVIIREGVNIGDGAVIGSGSVVTRDVEPYSIVAGSPAQFLKMRFNSEDLTAYKRMLFE